MPVGCLSLIEGRLGVLEHINEEIKLSQGTDQAIVFKLSKAVPTPNTFIKFYPLKKNIFEINHYAGPVPYRVDGFLGMSRWC